MQWVRAIVAAVFAATLALPPVAGAAPLYTLLDLGTLNPASPDASTRAFDVNELGQVVGSSGNAAGRLEAFRTAPNSPINPLTDGLGSLGGPVGYSEALAINDLGQVAGSVAGPNGSDGSRAFVTKPNQRIDAQMGTFAGGTTSLATAINNSGRVAGTSFLAASPPGPNDPQTHAFRTSSSRPLADSDDLGTLSAAPPRLASVALGINERGQAVGWSYNREGHIEAFRASADAPINAATDGLGTFGGNSSASAINLHGRVVGYFDLVGGGYGISHAFRTAPDAQINPLTDDLGTLGGARSFAIDINDLGVVVGSSSATADPDPPDRIAPTHAFVYMDGEGMLDLNSLIANGIPAGWTLSSAEGINNRGQIVGHASVGNHTRSFLLTPVPEPSVLGLPFLALLLARRAARRHPRHPRK